MLSVWEQISTQRASLEDFNASEGYFSAAFLSVAQAFISGLKGGACPLSPNPLDAPSTFSAGRAATTPTATGVSAIVVAATQ